MRNLTANSAPGKGRHPNLIKDSLVCNRHGADGFPYQIKRDRIFADLVCYLFTRCSPHFPTSDSGANLRAKSREMRREIVPIRHRFR